MSTGVVPAELRVDARNNRDRILEVARATFAESGLDVPMKVIARRSGVAVATLYRRFPTKQSLMAAAFDEQVAACAAVIDEALAEPDAWRGFTLVVEKACAMHVLFGGFTAEFLAAFPKAADFRGEREHNVRGFAEIVRRAKAGGRLRADFTPDDLKLLLMANGGITAASPEAARASSRRLVALLLRSLRADPADPPAELPFATPLELYPVT
ncbi:TetR/AcrR family transcriptional regulator [Umezawaea sp. Da 62-37]|uniref:TetR/AcrR family transcriptional regulator n=1 Tax=Umezawaea sp. Da 62-37 TaxID=3075927 RepID=UPI0028F715FB|nr:TetR/AcrR family transcriptional regulator [Umezawaea sp. Da 62-37]WNV86125.1 TetR/AcrR family transcriptional regulator [Umezawaea sp. Da 62-37]